MLKIEELNRADSCLSRADMAERIFVLLARDQAAPQTIRFWANERVRLGKNLAGDQQIQEALLSADLMEQEWAARQSGVVR